MSEEDINEQRRAILRARRGEIPPDLDDIEPSQLLRIAENRRRVRARRSAPSPSPSPSPLSSPSLPSLPPSPPSPSSGSQPNVQQRLYRTQGNLIPFLEEWHIKDGTQFVYQNFLALCEMAKHRDRTFMDSIKPDERGLDSIQWHILTAVGEMHPDAPNYARIITPSRRGQVPLLSLPLSNFYGFSTSLALYIMYAMSIAARDSLARPMFAFFATAVTDGVKRTTFVNREFDRKENIAVKDRGQIVRWYPKRDDSNGAWYIEWSDIVSVFMNVQSYCINYFHSSIQADLDGYNEDRESGDFFRTNTTNPNMRLYIRLTFPYTNEYRPSRMWNEEVAEDLARVFPRGGYITVKNDDEYCGIYCILIGVAKKINRFLLLDEGNCIDMDKLRFSYFGYHPLVRPDLQESIPLNHPCRFFWHFGRVLSLHLEHFEQTVAKSVDLQSFCSVMQELEESLLIRWNGQQCIGDLSIYALDVYCIDMKMAHPKIYPAYISKRKANESERISLLCCLKGEKYCHFALISDMNKLFSENGGRMFYTCSKCKRSFFTNKLLLDHKCEGKSPANVPFKEYSWSERCISDKTTAMPAAVCNSCHLKFVSREDHEYHAAHCFMRGRRGFRYVSLPEVPELKGKEGTGVDKDNEVQVDSFLAKKYVCFADFESTINPETGEHKFMSFGLWDDVRQEYESEYASPEDGIKPFFDCIRGKFNKTVKKIYVYFHNAMGYDANFILRYVLLHDKDECKNWKIHTIMESSNRIKSLRFTFDGGKELVIGDTYKFFTLSLDSIVKSMRKEDIEANKAFFVRFWDEMLTYSASKGEVDDESINIVLRKNLYPYKWWDTLAKKDVPFPEFSTIFHPLEENLKYFAEGTTVEDLQKFLPILGCVQRAFQMEFAGDYHDLYLRCDVLQIADVFMHARKTIFMSHDIDLCDYIGMPSATWEAFLRNDPALSLPLYENTKFAEFFKSMTRGGVTSAPLRYAKADESHKIAYFDVNGLYPFVMREYKYPSGDFQWWDGKEVAPLEGSTLNDTLLALFRVYKSTSLGACFCVDLLIPPELKIKTDQFPLAPEHILIKDQYFDENGELYPFLKQWQEANEGEIPKAFKGLVGTLYDKEKYTLHWRLLKFYIKMGMIVTKVHNFVTFTEASYLNPYVSKNIELRNHRTDELGKMVYKLMSNALYGKTFEDPFNRESYEIINQYEKLAAMIEQGNVSSITPIDEDHCVVKLDGEQIVLDKPTYIGACVTEYAKLHMYKIFYKKLPAIFGEFGSVELVYTDTDSFIVRLPTLPGWSVSDFFKHIKTKDPSFLGSLGGQLKSETGEELIDEVVALRSKLYAYKTTSGHIGKRAKGTTAAAQSTQLEWESYVRTMMELKSIPTLNAQFRRQSFTITSLMIDKISLSANDGKRRIEPDGIHTHAWGF